MPYMAKMLGTHPQKSPMDATVLGECVEACFECAAVCTACADSCLSESGVADLIACIRTDLDCADVCDATGRILSRQSSPGWKLIRAQLESCAAACAVCAEECDKHASEHEHCRVCAEACRRCEQSCKKLLQKAASA